MSKVSDDTLRIEREVRNENGPAEEALRAKCQWEHMSRTAVIATWGDPREWHNKQFNPTQHSPAA